MLCLILTHLKKETLSSYNLHSERGKTDNKQNKLNYINADECYVERKSRKGQRKLRVDEVARENLPDEVT